MEPVWRLSTTPVDIELSLTESFGLLSAAGDFLFKDMLGAADAYIGRQSSLGGKYNLLSRLDGKHEPIILMGKYDTTERVDGEA